MPWLISSCLFEFILACFKICPVLYLSENVFNTDLSFIFFFLCLFSLSLVPAQLETKMRPNKVFSGFSVDSHLSLLVGLFGHKPLFLLGFC